MSNRWNRSTATSPVLNTIYEIQLKSISSQLDNIDRVNVGLRNIREMYEGSKCTTVPVTAKRWGKMTQYMAQLNSVYRNMLTAMTVNMYRSTRTSGTTSKPRIRPITPTVTRNTRKTEYGITQLEICRPGRR